MNHNFQPINRLGMRALQMVFIIGLAFAFSFCSFSSSESDHFDTVIGEIQEGNPVITLDESIITGSWEAVLAIGGVEVDLSELAIVEMETDVYYLIASDSGDTIRCAVSLVLDGDDLYEQKHSGNGISAVCSTDNTCYETDMCQPVVRDGKGYCEPWCEPCERTVSLRAGEPIIDVD
jgi:hypothetical protein